MLNYDNIQHMQFFLFKLYLQTSKNSYNCIQKTNCMRIIGFQSNSEGKMGKTLAYKILENHLVEGKLIPGEEIKIKVDQTLTQDSTGTMVPVIISHPIKGLSFTLRKLSTALLMSASL